MDTLLSAIWRRACGLVAGWRVATPRNRSINDACSGVCPLKPFGLPYCQLPPLSVVLYPAIIVCVVDRAASVQSIPLSLSTDASLSVSIAGRPADPQYSHAHRHNAPQSTNRFRSESAAAAATAASSHRLMVSYHQWFVPAADRVAVYGARRWRRFNNGTRT